MKHSLFCGIIGWAALTSAPAAAVAPCPATAESFRELRSRVAQPSPHHIVVVAHRGCYAAASENSPQAIDACWQQGVEVVENDVRRTSDGHLVVFHDPEISRMTDRWGYVANMTLAELRAARLKERDGSHEAYRANFVTNQPIATLEEYLAAVKHKVMVNFEIKYSSREEFVSMFDQSVAIARRMGVLDHIVFKIPDTRHHGRSSSTHLLQGLALSPDIQTMPIIWESEIPIAVRLAFFESYRPLGYEIPFEKLEYFAPVRTIERLAGKPVMAVTVQPYWSGGLDDRLAMRSPDTAWGRLIELGADHIMTDRPEALLRYLEGRGARMPRSCD